MPPHTDFDYWSWPGTADSPPQSGLGHLSELIGHTALLTERGLQIRVQIDDVRQCYGRDECRVHPVSGSGMRWIHRHRLTLDNED